MTLVLHFARVFGGAVFGCLIGLTAIGIAVDLLDAVGELREEPGGPGLLRYAALRAAPIAAAVALMSVLAGGALGFFRLAQRNEMTVLRAAGLSLSGALARLAPLALVLGVGYAALAFWGAPAAERALALSFDGPLDESAPGASDSHWIRTSGALLRFGSADRTGATLRDVTLFEVPSAGGLEARVDARSATWSRDGWALEDGARRSVEGLAPTPFDRRFWSTRLTPAEVLRSRAAPETVTAGEVRAALAGAALAPRAPSFYAVQAHRAGASLLKPYLMLLFASPLGLAAARGAGARYAACLGLALGAAFVGVEQMAASLGQRGVIPAAAAVWGPMIAFGFLAFWTIVLAEEK